MVFTQFGQVDSVAALATCAAAPAACTDFTKILAALTQVSGSAREVIALVGQGMARGPEGGTNQFYAAPIAIDVVRFHSDADPDFAAETILDALETVLRDPVATRASTGSNGFFKHAVDGLDTRLVIRNAIEVPTQLRARAVTVLRQLTALGVPEAATLLGAIGESATAAPASPEAAAAQEAAASAAVAPPAAKTVSPLKIVLAVGFGVVAIAGIAIAIGMNSRSTATLAKAGRLRQKAEAGLRRQGDRSRDL